MDELDHRAHLRALEEAERAGEEAAADRASLQSRRQLEDPTGRRTALLLISGGYLALFGLRSDYLAAVSGVRLLASVLQAALMTGPVSRARPPRERGDVPDHDPGDRRRPAEVPALPA